VQNHWARPAPGAARLAAEVGAALLLYDAFFTAAHVACHRWARLYRAAHAKHHARRVQRAPEALRLAPVELAVDVAASVAALNLLGAHPLSRAAYNVAVVYLIIELHAGYSFPWAASRVVPRGLWGGPVQHARHHARGDACFAKFATPLDALMGTAFK
jgi:sterol desaturase/sphingolipid hydroxylase (fatty acid hydroxylase superfamily)